jgi:hypothetical protein
MTPVRNSANTAGLDQLLGQWADARRLTPAQVSAVRAHALQPAPRSVGLEHMPGYGALLAPTAVRAYVDGLQKSYAFTATVWWAKGERLAS